MVKREDLFITGKLWNSDHDVEIVPKACEHSLSNLGLDYFDLYLIHFPICWKHTGIATPSWGSSELGTTPLIDTWKAMEELVEKGICKSIGVSNYPMMLMHDLVTQAKVQPACNQIEVHAYYQRESLVNYCLARNVSIHRNSQKELVFNIILDYSNNSSFLCHKDMCHCSYTTWRRYRKCRIMVNTHTIAGQSHSKYCKCS